MARARSGKQDPEAIIRSAIEYAEKWAGDDDKAYLRALNETYRAGLAKIRSRGGAARSAAAPAPKEIQIYNDPRYLKNAESSRNALWAGPGSLAEDRFEQESSSTASPWATTPCGAARGPSSLRTSWYPPATASTTRLASSSAITSRNPGRSSRSANGTSTPITGRASRTTCWSWCSRRK